MGLKKAYIEVVGGEAWEAFVCVSCFAQHVDDVGHVVQVIDGLVQRAHDEHGVFIEPLGEPQVGHILQILELLELVLQLLIGLKKSTI